MLSHILPPHGGYQSLLSFQKSEIVYAATVKFCADLLDRRDRTVDQMIQAARSGKQNIVEGSQASGTSKEMELKLTSVARASLEELLTNYRDFLRTRGFEEWPQNHPHVKRLRELNRLPNANYATFKKSSGAPESFDTRQCDLGAYQGDQLPARPANPATRASLHPRRRPPRTNDPRPPPNEGDAIIPRLIRPSGPARPFYLPGYRLHCGIL